jgi:hypothetical protein
MCAHLPWLGLAKAMEPCVIEIEPTSTHMKCRHPRCLELTGFGNNKTDYEAPFGRKEGSFVTNLRVRCLLNGHAILGVLALTGVEGLVVVALIPHWEWMNGLPVHQWQCFKGLDARQENDDELCPKNHTMFAAASIKCSAYSLDPAQVCDYQKKRVMSIRMNLSGSRFHGGCGCGRAKGLVPSCARPPER